MFGQAYELSPLNYLPSSTVTYQDEGLSVPGAAVMHVDVALPESLVLSLGALSFYAVTGPPGASAPTVAATTDLVAMSGFVMMVQEDPQAQAGGGGTVYKPLRPPGEYPPSWIPGQVCLQQSTVTGTVGPWIVKTVVSADCKPSDSHCMPPSCKALEGTTSKCLDPLSFLGG